MKPWESNRKRWVTSDNHIIYMASYLTTRGRVSSSRAQRCGCQPPYHSPFSSASLLLHQHPNPEEVAMLLHLSRASFLQMPVPIEENEDRHNHTKGPASRFHHHCRDCHQDKHTLQSTASVTRGLGASAAAEPHLVDTGRATKLFGLGTAEGLSHRLVGRWHLEEDMQRADFEQRGGIERLRTPAIK